MIGLTLRQQIANEARYWGDGWDAMVDELGDTAVEIAGSNMPVSSKEFKAICREVFRAEQ